MLSDIGIEASAISDNTDLIIVDRNTGEAAVLDHFYISGNYVDTAFGQLIVFIDETGEFGGEAGTYGFMLMAKNCIP